MATTITTIRIIRTRLYMYECVSLCAAVFVTRFVFQLSILLVYKHEQQKEMLFSNFKYLHRSNVCTVQMQFILFAKKILPYV